MTFPGAGDLHKPKRRRRIAVGFILLCLTLLIVTRQPPASRTDPIEYDLISSLPQPPEIAEDGGASCDLSRGEWVPDLAAPYYTNQTCWMIQDHQNCMKYGRPDTGYLRWRWKPDGCELRRFEPAHFLEAMRGKKMAFVGDSLSRNHMQSLMCLLSRVAYPKDISSTSNHDNRIMFYEKYRFTLSVFWSPYFTRYYDPDENNKFWRIYLDEVDQNWISHIAEFDYVIIANGNWFARPSLFFEGGKLVGCNYCQLPNVTELSLLHSNKMCFRTALSAIVESSFRGMVFLRTMSPDHFENGEWNKGGNCVRTMPFRRGERKPTWLEGELYKGQAEEFAAAAEKEKGRGTGRVVFRLLDIMEAMLQRPDGHPNSYGHQQSLAMRNDCVHWCLPGPIDAWNDLLFRMIRDSLADPRGN